MNRTNKQAIIDQLTEQLATAQRNIQTLRRQLYDAEAINRRYQSTRREAMQKAKDAAQHSGVSAVANFHSQH